MRGRWSRGPGVVQRPERSEGALWLLAGGDEAALSLLAAAPGDAAVVARWQSKIVDVGSGCRWWTVVISGPGHGRFWFAPGRVVIAHRFAFAVVQGVTELSGVQVLGHRCDNPLRQRRHWRRWPSPCVVPQTILGGRYYNWAYHGPITRTIEDSALMLDVVAGPHNADPLSIARVETSYPEAIRGDLSGLRAA